MALERQLFLEAHVRGPSGEHYADLVHGNTIRLWYHLTAITSHPLMM